MSGDARVVEVDAAAYAKLQTLFGERFETMRAQFIQNSRGYVAELQAGVTAQSKEQIVAAAHKIRSSSGLFGLTTVQALAKELDQTGYDASIDVSAALGSQLAHAFEESIARWA